MPDFLGVRLRFCGNSRKALITRLGLGALLISLLSPLVQGQTLRDEGQRLIDEQRQRERDESQSRPPAKIARPGEPQKPATQLPAELPEGSPAFLINSIALIGDPVFSEHERAALVAPFLGLKLGPPRLDLLLHRITAAYLDKGFLTTRAYIGPQSLASGQLDITIIPGQIEAITLNGETLAGLASTAFPTESGALLKLNDLEQATDQINRLRSQRAEAQILPGQSPGGSVIAIDTHPQKPWRVGVGVDDYGQAASGETRHRLSAELDNLLGAWDTWSVVGLQSEHSRTELLSMSVPVGYGTFSYAYAQSWSQVSLAGLATSQTQSNNHTVGWNQVVARNQAARYDIDTTLALRESRRQIDTFSLTPQRQSVARIAGNAQFRLAQGSVNLGIGYGVGLSGFGAQADIPDLPGSAPHNQFEKWDLSLNSLWALNKDLAWKAQLSGQSTQHGLPGQDQMFLGGASSVRGFKEGILSADRGLLMRNELQWTGPLSRMVVSNGGRLDPFLLFDLSRSRLFADASDRRLVSAGIGLRGAWKFVSTDLSLAKPLVAPDTIARDTRLHFSVDLQF